MGTDLLSRMMLALAVWREARGESPRGKRLVADVIVNRSKSKGRWPGNIRDVVMQRAQFSSFNSGDPNALEFPSYGQTWLDCVISADAAIAGPAITTANHYHTVNVSPAWKDSSKVVDQEGAHVFYRL